MKKALMTIFTGVLIPWSAMAIEDGTSSGSLEVPLGRASLMRLSTVPAQIVVGNPAVADITVQSAKTLAVFGKAPGGTSLSALDGKGNVLWEKTVVVTPAGADGVSVHYGTGKNWRPGGEVVSIACTSQRCASPTPMPNPAPQGGGAANSPPK